MSLISDLVKYTNKTYEKGFVSATDGNLSVRLDSEKIAITKSGINNGDVGENDIVIIDSNGNKISGEGNPSSESKIHLLAYNNRSDINAVIHCHPVYSTAFATSGYDLTKSVFPEVILNIGPVPLCRYGTPSTDELPGSMMPFISTAWAMLLQNHGAVSFGEDLSSAYNRMEKLEHSAKTIFISRLLGGEIPLSDENVRKLYSLAETAYGIKPVNYKKRPYNHNAVHSSNVNQNSYIEIIEERLRARAGNPVHNSFENRMKSESNQISSKLSKKLLSDFNGE